VAEAALYDWRAAAEVLTEGDCGAEEGLAIPIAALAPPAAAVSVGAGTRRGTDQKNGAMRAAATCASFA
jgi:hypothetical protein